MSGSGSGNETPAAERPPLWPQPIEVVGLTGEYASGKTLFALSISPGPTTLVYDTEKSAGTYQNLGFERMDLAAAMLRKHPKGHQPIDLFRFWRDDIRSRPPNKYRVIVLDTVSEIESGLVAYVRANPTEFGYTSAQFARGEALVWGAVKDHWKAILSDLAARCETFAFTSHMRDKFAGGQPTGKREPKGKETLMELASLYLQMERIPDKKGNVPAVPSAVVLKSRLATTSIGEDGEVRIVPTLPPRIPKATPGAIRQYMLKPPDYEHLTAAERAPEDKPPTEAEVEQLRLARANAERDAEALRLDRLNRQQAAAAAPTKQTFHQPTLTRKELPADAPRTPEELEAANRANAAKQPPPAAAATTPATGKPAAAGGPLLVTAAQLQRIAEFREALAIDDELWAKVLAKRNVQRTEQLRVTDATEILNNMARKRHEQEMAAFESDQAAEREARAGK